MLKLPKTIERLIQELQKLPGIGRKSAERIAFYLLSASPEDARALTQAITQLKEKVHYCPQCFNITERELCDICSDTQRDMSRLCVVETVVDIMAIEKSGAYTGLYHCLQGRLSPLEGITHKDLRISELKKRVQASKELVEIIIATTTGVEGEATATYLAEQLKPFGKKITRIGLGLPSGGSLEFADALTLRKALESRQPL
ncbi:recombination protein RecR [Candidatus Sumerlaeota bacterium]|nr:recombination protein RecR [Candidatus Sumerlaeota bacterium]